MSAKETNNQAVQTTTHYWGYRELDANEVDFVGGGYDGDGNTMGDFGGTCGPGYTSDSGAASAAAAALAGVVAAGMDAAANAAACAQARGLALVGLVQNVTNPLGMALAGAQAYSGWCSDGSN
jgi:hypothetical protein